MTKKEDIRAEHMAAIREAVATAAPHEEMYAAFEAHFRMMHADEEAEDKPSRKDEIEAARKARADKSN